ncbi:MAG TPA: acyl-CoA reductase, partial [Verrucomicrobiae bacterium]
MTTPNYFLADLPAEALTPMMVSEACIAIKRNRAQFLLKRNTSSLIRTIVTIAEDWQDNAYPFRQRALNEAPAEIGFSKEVIARGLDEFFSQFTKRNLEDLIIQDLGHVNRLDEMTATETEHGGERASRAIGSELLVHVAGGALPNPTLLSMLLGLLVRSAQFVKCSTGGALIPRLLAHSIYAIDPKLGACIELGAWQGGNTQLEDALFSH